MFHVWIMINQLLCLCNDETEENLNEIKNHHVTRKKRGVKPPRAAARDTNIWFRN